MQLFYDAFNRLVNATGLSDRALFLNFGYRGPRRSPVELPPDCSGIDSQRLVLELVESEPVDGREVLDVGCGRGGTLAVLRQNYTPRSTTGLDLSAQAVQFCQARWPGQTFLQGDAENLPWHEPAFDLVTNLESACHYDDLPGFYAGVSRALRPGGAFLYGDLVPSAELEERRGWLLACGLAPEVERDVTAGVLESLRANADRRMGYLEQVTAREPALEKALDATHRLPPLELLAEMLCVPGSRNFKSLLAGEKMYLLARWRKPVSGTSRDLAGVIETEPTDSKGD